MAPHTPRAYDATVARIAGNILGHLLVTVVWPGNDGVDSRIPSDPEPQHIRLAVKAARDIVAEVQRTEPVKPHLDDVHNAVRGSLNR